MSDKVKKIDKEFLFTDNSVNVYGFRLLTEGYLMDKYQSNPIGYRMHKRDDGVVLKWTDFRKEGDKVYAKPVINLSNPLGQQTADEVENGFLNAASVGKIVVLEYSDDPSLQLEGQTGPTITKWYHKELSLVDLPGNNNALATALSLEDENGNEINLADFVHQTLKKQALPFLQGVKSFNLKDRNTMSLKAKVLPILLAAGFINLSDASDDSEFARHIQDLADKAGKMPKLEADLAAEKTAKENAVKDLADHKSAENKKAIEAITKDGVEKGKLTAAVAKDLSDKFADDPEGYKKIVEGLPAYKTAAERMAEASKDGKSLADLTWEELDKSGQLEDLKAADFDTFKEKFKARFKAEFKG